MFLARNQGSIATLPVRSIISISVRNFGPKTFPDVFDDRYRGELPRRIGYEAHHFTRGLLPRLRIKEKKLPTIPITTKEDPWSPRLATMGKNDFMRILGDESIQQHELLTHIPDWLRGYRANTEFSVLMRKRKEFDHWKYTKPLKWLHLEQRIKFLYRRLNNKYEPPNVQLIHKSRY